VKAKLFAVLVDGIALIAALAFVVSVPAFAQSWKEKAISVFAITGAEQHLPAGAKLVARVRLDGRPVTYMYSRSEYGRMYLYIGHGQYSFTTADIRCTGNCDGTWARCSASWRSTRRVGSKRGT